MNKEEMEKAKEEAYWKGYIQKQKEAEEICKMCKYRKKYKELEQKSNVLDKVTAKLKEDRDLFNKLRKTHKEYSPSEERLTTKYFYILNLLNIIEGEEKNEK